jgi:hypothetical protein
MEEEVRVILRETTQTDEHTAGDWVDAIRALVEPLGGIDVPLPDRRPLPDPPRFAPPQKRTKRDKVGGTRR